MSRCVVYQSGGFTNYGISYRKYSQEELEERSVENPMGAYALYMFLKDLIEDGKLKESNDNSEIYFVDEDGVAHKITDYSFDNKQDLMLW
mgnify:FL=1